MPLRLALPQLSLRGIHFCSCPLRTNHIAVCENKTVGHFQEEEVNFKRQFVLFHISLFCPLRKQPRQGICDTTPTLCALPMSFPLVLGLITHSPDTHPHAGPRGGSFIHPNHPTRGWPVREKGGRRREGWASLPTISPRLSRRHFTEHRSLPSLPLHPASSDPPLSLPFPLIGFAWCRW